MFAIAIFFSAPARILSAAERQSKPIIPNRSDNLAYTPYNIQQKAYISQALSPEKAKKIRLLLRLTDKNRLLSEQSKRF